MLTANLKFAPAQFDKASVDKQNEKKKSIYIYLYLNL